MDQTNLLYYFAGKMLQFWIVVWALVTVAMCRGEVCGSPGRPAFSSGTPADYYSFGEKHPTQCIEGYFASAYWNQTDYNKISSTTIKSDSERFRTCLANGTWSGDAEFCYAKQKLHDTNICKQAQWNGYNKLYMTEFLTSSTVVDLVMITLPDDAKTVIGIQMILSRNCSQTRTLQLPSADSIRLFQVNYSKPEDVTCVQKIVIYSPSYFEFCKVVVYGRHEVCGTPETPAYGKLIRINTTTVQYSCNPGYLLNGNEYRYCNQGLWTGTQVVCEQSKSFTSKILNAKADETETGLHKLRFFTNIAMAAIIVSLITLAVVVIGFALITKNSRRTSGELVQQRGPSALFVKRLHYNNMIYDDINNEENRYNEIYAEIDHPPCQDQKQDVPIYAQPMKKKLNNPGQP